MTRPFLAIACSTLLLLPMLAHASDASAIDAAQYAQALQGPWRSAQNSARDRYRHPQQTLSFFGLRADQTVIEITPGNGWYSEILAPLLKDHGRYVAAVDSAETGEVLERKFKAEPGTYGEAHSLRFEAAAPSFGPPASADLLLTFRNVHNWVMANDAGPMFAAFFKVLKPGGVLGVVDHRAKDPSDLASIQQSGYLPTAYVVKLATDAGFVLQAHSEINANPNDRKDYPAGVWTLPPALTLGDQDRARYLAIGESDRMTLRFVKPAATPAK